MDTLTKLIKGLLKKRYYLIIFISIILIYSFTSFIYFNLNKNSENFLNLNNKEIVSKKF